MTEFKWIEYEKVEQVGRIWLNRPETANAQHVELLIELDDALTLADRDEDVRVVIIGSRGKHFSSGHDMKAKVPEGARRTLESRWAQEEYYFYHYCMRIYDLKKPTIAQVQGGAIGAGFMIANMCDLIVASEEAFFSDPTLFTHASPGVELFIHPWVLGDRKAKELLFTADRLSARDAQTAGMVNRVVPLESLDAETLALASKIAKIPPFALMLTKRAFARKADLQGFRTAMQAGFDIHQLGHSSEEQRLLKLNWSGEERIAHSKKIGETARSPVPAK